MSGPVGLDYREVRYQARLWGIDIGRRNMRKIQALEQEALTHAYQRDKRRDQPDP